MEQPEHIKQLKVLQDEAANCVKCELHKSRKKAVFSRGNPEAKVIIAGINPGSEENESGIPFVGKSGKLLDTTLQSLGVDIEKDVYIMNAVKCHSPDNRLPTPEETQSCFSYLERHLTLLPGKVIIALGTFPMHLLTDELKGITKARGSWYKWKDKEVIVAFHPSFIIRSGSTNSPHYESFEEDIQAAFDKAKSL